MSTHANHGDPTRGALPSSCIRGPEIRDVDEVEQHIAASDEAALTAYQRGIDQMVEIHRLLQRRAHLQELVQTKTFLLRQLTLLERQQPDAFARALARYDAAARVRTSAAAKVVVVESDG